MSMEYLAKCFAYMLGSTVIASCITILMNKLFHFCPAVLSVMSFLLGSALTAFCILFLA